MSNLNTNLSPEPNIRPFSVLNENEKKALIEKTNDPSQLINLFEEHSWHEEGDASHLLFEKIEKLAGNFDSSQIQKVTEKISSLHNPIQPSIKSEKLKNKMVDFSYRNINNGNVFTLLRQAKAENSLENINRCLKFIGESQGIAIAAHPHLPPSLSIEINSPKVPIDGHFSSKIGLLSTIFDGQIQIDFTSVSSIEYRCLREDNSQGLNDFKDFLKQHGKEVRQLNLGEFEERVDDNLLKEIADNCPNLSHLSIRSPEVTGEGLNFSHLKNLTSLNFNNCRNLRKLPDLPNNLRALSLNNSKALPEKWPKSLEELSLSGMSLFYLAANVEQLPNSITKLDLSSCHILNDGILEAILPDSLIELNLSDSDLTELPKLRDSIKVLHLCNCEDLERITELPNNLESLDLSGSRHLVELPVIPESVRTLKFACDKLKEVPKLPENLLHLEIKSNQRIHLSENSIRSLLPAMASVIKHAKESNSIEELNNSFKFIYQAVGVEIKLKESPLSISISSLRETKLPNEDLFNLLDNLIKIFDPDNKQFRIDLPANLFKGELQSLEKFLEKQGKAVRTLQLVNNDKINDELCKKIIQFCPNLEVLNVSSKNIHAENLDFSPLKNLTMLNLSDCTEIRKPPKLPDSLEYLNLSGCAELAELLENWPPGIKLKCLNCPNLPESVRLSALSSIFDANFNQGLGCDLEIKDKEVLFKLLVEKFSKKSNIDEQKYKEVFFDSLENKQISMLLIDFVLNNFTGSDISLFTEEELFKMAKLSAKQFGDYTSNHIWNFGIQDPAQKFEIAKLCAKQSGDYFTFYLENFEIEDENQQREILNLCLLNTSSEIKRFDLIITSLFYEKIAEIDKNGCFKQLIYNYDNGRESPPELIDNALEILKSFAENTFPNNPFAKVLENVMQIPDPFIRRQNFLWLANAIIKAWDSKDINQLSDAQLKQLGDLGIFEAIAEIRKPELRYALADASLAAGQVESVEKSQNWQKLTNLLYSVLISQGVNIAEGSFRSEMNKASSPSHRQALIEMLLLIQQDTTLSATEKGQLLNRIVLEGKNAASPNSKDLSDLYLRNINAVIAVFNFNKPEQFNDISKTLVAISEAITKDKFCCGDVENFTDKFAETFGQCRNPAAVITYLAKISSLGEPSSSASFGRFITSVLNGTFKEDRYKLDDNNPHLKKIYEYDGGKLLEKWKQNRSVRMGLLDEKTPVVEEASNKVWMETRLKKYFDLKTLNLKSLANYLENPNSGTLKNTSIALSKETSGSGRERNEALKVEPFIKEINQRCMNILELQNAAGDSDLIEKEINQIKKNLAQLKNLSLIKKDYPTLKNMNITQANATEDIQQLQKLCDAISEHIVQAKENYKTLMLQSACIEWMMENENLEDLRNMREKLDPQKDKAEFNNLTQKYESIFGSLKIGLEQIKKIVKEPPFESPEFAKDLEDKLKEKSKMSSSKIIIKTDNPIDLLLYGTEVPSCQRVDGQPDLNKGLLGIIWNAWNTPLFCKSEEGPNGIIEDRCKLSLMPDPDGKPALYMEKLYPSDIKPEKARELVALALEEARELGVPLVSQESTGENFGKSLMALGGAAPWEYSDGATIPGITQGKYEVTDLKYVKAISDHKKCSV
jgi:hypothetical protein